MWKSGVLVLCCLPVCRAEVHTMSLREAVERALKESPDVVLARLETEKAEQAARLAHSVFVPNLVVGSGLAATYGSPESIDG